MDQTMIGETMIGLYGKTGKLQYRSAAKHLATYLMDRSKLETTSLAYREGNPIRLADGIGMICPFLTRYAATFNCPEARRLAISQLREFNHFGIDRRSGLPFHGYNPAMNFSPGVCMEINRHSTQYTPSVYAQGAALAGFAITEDPHQ